MIVISPPNLSMSFCITAKVVKGPSSVGFSMKPKILCDEVISMLGVTSSPCFIILRSIDLCPMSLSSIMDDVGVWMEFGSKVLRRFSKNFLDLVPRVILHHNLDDYMRQR